MKGTFERTIAAGAILLAVFLVVNGAISHRNLRAIRDDADLVAHTHEVLQVSGKLLGSLRDIESGQRGYAITGDRRFFEPARAAMQAYPALQERLVALTSDNAPQAERVRELAGLIARRVEEARRCVETLDRGDMASARSIIETGEGNRCMGGIRAAAAEIEAHERRLLDERRDSADMAYAAASATLFFSTTIGLAAVAVFAILLSRHLGSRARAEAVILEQRELFRATLAGMDDGVVVTDLAGRITFINSVAQKLTGWSGAESLLRPRDDVYRTESPGRAGAEPTERHDTVLVCRDGSRRAVEHLENPLRDRAGAITGSVLVFRDITSRKAHELELTTLAQRLAESDRRKDEFLATLAHELRNPLAPIRNGLEILRLTSGNTAIDPVCDVMNRQLNHLVRLVDDLLDVSRISRNKLQLRLERIDLATAIQSAVEACQPLAESNGVALVVSLPEDRVELNADPTRLAQIFSNLLNNAAKYTERGGRIELTARRSGNEVEVRIRDTGVGIPPDMLARVFDMFAQIESTLERAQGGLGIGLMIVQRLVAMHGGRVDAHSEGEGRGSEFVVHLPAIPPADGTRPSEPAPPPAGASTSFRTLVVDDNRDSAESLGRLLELWGHDVHVAHDGTAAVEAAGNLRPEVVLLDLGLPGMNGYDVCRRIRGMEGGDRVLIIAQTGWGQTEDRRLTHEAGFNHHLVKPVNAKVLNALLATWASRASQT
ncbi:MAG: CHASE3 domain-containing protein [Gemmataceae bacterium]